MKKSSKRSTLPRELVHKSNSKAASRKQQAEALQTRRFYEHPLVILFATFLFFPLGLYLFYRYGKFAMWKKLVIIAGVLLLAGGWFYYSI